MLFFELSTNQLNFFQRRGGILFEELLPENFFLELAKLASERQFSRNLWVNNQTFKKLAFYPSLVSLSCSLVKKPYLRMGFDTLLTKKKDLGSFFKDTLTFSLQNCFQPLSICVLINLSTEDITCTLVEKEKDPSSLILTPNSAFFFQPERFNLTFEDTEEEQIPENPLLYLIAYAEKNSRYVLCEKDPHTHDLKKKGYAFGDLLKDEEHPLVMSKISL